MGPEPIDDFPPEGSGFRSDHNLVAVGVWHPIVRDRGNPRPVRGANHEQYWLRLGAEDPGQPTDGASRACREGLGPCLGARARVDGEIEVVDYGKARRIHTHRSISPLCVRPTTL